MITILLDHHLGGRARHLRHALSDGGWMELAPMRFVTLRQIGLPVNTSDRAIWRLVQAQGMLLLTGNRNMEGDDSLEATLREENTPTALPIITISSPRRLDERDYRERCAERLAEIVFDLDQYRGVGRVYIP